MTLWVIVDVEGRVERRHTPQREVHQHLGGPITIVGAMPSLNAVIVSLQDSADLCEHSWNGCGFFMPETTVRGCIAIVASDEGGEEQDLDVNEMLTLVEHSRKKVASNK